MGGTARFLDPTFRGGASAVRVEYCATGACPWRAMRTLRVIVVTCVLLSSVTALVARADVAKPVDKVEEVDLDALEEDGPKKPRATAPSENVAGGTVIEEVKLDELAAAAPSPEYERSRWLLLLPLLAALAVVWNVDWREVRVKAEIAAARAKRAPKKKGTR